MEFSLIFEGQLGDTSRKSERQVFLDGVDQAVLADQLGFDRFYAVEHHGLEGYAHSSAPEVFLSYVAAKTKRIRVAHGVACLPFKMNHPVRVAERVSTLDILSGGRLDVGVGRSSSKREQETFGITAEETHAQLEHSLRAMVKMWTEDEMSYESEILNIPKRTIRPRPIQDPHPSLSLACTRGESLELAGKWGLGAISNGVDGPNQAKLKRKIYDDARAARKPGDMVGKFETDRFGTAVFTTILDDAEEARRIGMRGLRFFLESARYFFAGQGERPRPETWLDHAENMRVLDELTRPKIDPVATANAVGAIGMAPATSGVGLANASWSGVDFYDKATTAFGSANDTIQFVEGMQAAGVDEAMFVVQVGGVPQEAVMETIQQLGDKVIPHFRKASPTVISLSNA